ncbi:MAG: hypothetical protein QF368_08090, partial [SAR202 cluster bacterium]|nr:hypothetical protein [SAR202 cluster bacterium]
MANERIQRRVERLLDRIDTAEASDNWQEVVYLARDVLAVDEENREALAYLQAAERNLGHSSEAEDDSFDAENIEPSVAPPFVDSTQPTSFADD